MKLRDLLLDLESSGQVIGIKVASDDALLCGRITKVGDDFIICEHRAWATGTVIGMRVYPLGDVQGLELRPAADDRNGSEYGATFCAIDDDDPPPVTAS